MPDPLLLRGITLSALPDTAGPVAGTVDADGYVQPDGWQHVVFTFEQTTVAGGTGTRLAGGTAVADVTVYYTYTVAGRTPISGITQVLAHPIRNGLEAIVPPGATVHITLSALTNPTGTALGLNVFVQSIRK